MPLLVALGWSEQRIKIKWRHTDIVLFGRPYERGAKPDVIVESKRIHEGLKGAQGQVRRYAKEFPDCGRLVVSDGLRYYLYERQGRDWAFETDLAAYMNLLKLKARHPYLANVGGALELCGKQRSS